MRIVVISSCYPRKTRPYSGVFIHQQLKALVQLGFEVHLIQVVNWFPPFGLYRLHPYWREGHDELSEMHNDLDDVQIHHPRLFVKIPSRFFRDNRMKRMGELIGNFILRHKQLRGADWIYSHFLWYEGYVGAIASQKTGIPLAAMAWGDDVHAWPENDKGIAELLPFVLNSAKLLLANSQRLANDAKYWFPPGLEKEIKVVYSGVDLDKFYPVQNVNDREELRRSFTLPLDKLLLLCVATPVKLKGWLELFDAIQTLGSEFDAWKLVMVAPERISTDALNLIHESEKRGITDRVIFVGKVHFDKMPDLMRSVDAFILPSYNEGFSNAVLEAMATGLAVVATDVGGHKELIDNEINGLLPLPRSAQALIHSLRLINNTAFRAKFASNARMSVENRIGTFKENAQKLKRLFSCHDN